MGLTWQLDLSASLTRAEKYVLLAYADHADQSGRNIYPSVDLVARKTGYSERAVQTATRRLEENGYLIPDGQGPRGTNRYRIPLQTQNGASKIVPIPPTSGGGADSAPPCEDGANPAPDASQAPENEPKTGQNAPENPANNADSANPAHPGQGGAISAPLSPGGAEIDMPPVSKSAPEGIAPEETAPEPEVEVVFKPMGASAPAPFLEKPDEDLDIESLIAAYPPDCQPGVRLLYELFRLLPPEKPPENRKGGLYALWITGLRDLVGLARQYNTPLERAMRLTWQVWNDRPFTLSHPGALRKTMTSSLARAAKSSVRPPLPVAPIPTRDLEPIRPETEARMRALSERLRGANR